MSKKRKTRAQKIITRLRKELEKQKRQARQQTFQQESVGKTQKTNKKTSLSYFAGPAHSAGPQKTAKQVRSISDGGRHFLPVTFDPNLIKYDLLKTLYLSIIFFALIGLAYWYFEIDGEKVILSSILPTIRGFFHL
jgi:hypothetical protein